ncbi:hypothetical protein [uncultured Pseudomonas sp.]|uniref:hypothetical protein n=1 Tax=uncultured Pseudomonas sp. TaxID=114707 RepID=UPI0025FF28F1|nr:hypothetical protein [uncultured Pseudomonas sp.]
MTTTPPSPPLQVAAALLLGSLALLILGLQPLLLGELFTSGRASLDGLGLVAMGEIVALGLGVMLGEVLGQRLELPPLLLPAILLATGTDLLSAQAVGDLPLLGLRALAGLGEGLLLWAAVALMVRQPRAEWLSGLFMALQTFCQGLLAAALALWVLPNAGILGGFLLLSAVTALALPLLIVLPRRLAPVARQTSNPSSPGWTLPRGLLLACVGAQLAAIGALWAYLEPYGEALGLPPGQAQSLIALSLGAQLLGGLAGAGLVSRLPARVTLVLATLLLGTLAILIHGLPVGAHLAFVGLCLLFTFIWQTLTPFQIGLALSLDPSGRTATLVPSLQLLGCAAGPALASLWLNGAEVRPAALASALLSLLALSLLGLLGLSERTSRLPSRGRLRRSG